MLVQDLEMRSSSLLTCLHYWLLHKPPPMPGVATYQKQEAEQTGTEEWEKKKRQKASAGKQGKLGVWTNILALPIKKSS